MQTWRKKPPLANSDAELTSLRFPWMTRNTQDVASFDDFIQTIE